MPYGGVFKQLVKRFTRPLHALLIAVGFILAMILLVAGDTPVTYFSVGGFLLLFVFVIIFDAYQDNKKQEREDRKEQEEKRKQEKLSPSTKASISSRERHKEVIESQDAKEFWKPFVEGELQVVTGHFTKKDTARDDKVWEPAGLVGAGDAMAIAYLGTFFTAMDFSDFGVSYVGKDYKDHDDIRKRNLILLGASDYNRLTDMVMEEIKSTLCFGRSEKGHQIAIYDSTIDGEPWDWRIDPETNTLTDYSLIIKTKNPFRQRNQLLLVAGCSGYGTWAGVEFVTSIEFLEDSLVLSGAPCEFLLESKTSVGKPESLRIRRKARLGEPLQLS